MANFVQEKLEKLKAVQRELKNRKYTRKDAAIGVTVIMAVVTLGSISGYTPGIIQQMASGDSDKKVSLAEISKISGPQQTIVMEDKNPLRRRIQKVMKPEVSTLPSDAFGSMSNFGSSLGGFGSGFTPGVGGTSSRPTMDMAAYNHFKNLSDKMRSLLDSSFTLKEISPSSSGGRYTASYEHKDDGGTVLEKLELMTIVRTSQMADIKTAQEALDALVEESHAVHIIESHDDYLIYEFAGNGGYQIGKIAVNDKTIDIYGYVNLTTSELPDVLKTEWIGHYQNDL